MYKEFICKYFKVKDASHVSKDELMHKIHTDHKFISNMLLELFYANPDHEYFKTRPEAELAPMRVKRIERIGGI